MVHGVADPSVPLAAGEKVFADASPPKLMLTQPYVGTEGRILPATRVVITTTLGFFDRYLSQRLDALKALRKSVAGDIGFDLRVVES